MIKYLFTRAPKNHGCKPVDEWLLVRGSAPRNPVEKEFTAATAGYPTWCSIKPRSFTKTNPLSSFSMWFILLFILVPLCFIAIPVSMGGEETITITTYYPAPYGQYKELRTDQMSVGSLYRNEALTDGELIVSGNVGIGTPNPQGILDVDGGTATLGFGTTGEGRDILLKAENAAIGSSQKGGDIILWPGIGAVFNSGSVGIGTLLPFAKLHVLGGGGPNGDAGLFVSANSGFGNSDPQAKVHISPAGSLPTTNLFLVQDQISPDSTPFLIDANGNVGIGTTDTFGSPAYTNKFVVHTNPSATSPHDLVISGSGNNRGNIGINTQPDSGSKVKIEVDSSGPTYALSVRSTKPNGWAARFEGVSGTGGGVSVLGKMYATNIEALSGSFGGSVPPIANTALTVSNNSGIGIWVEQTQSTTGAGGPFAIKAIGTTWFEGSVAIGNTVWPWVGPPPYALAVTGAVASTSSTLASLPSDIRLKKNIVSLKDALETVLQLRGVSFEWKAPENHGDHVGVQFGFIAQEVEKVFPQWVTTDSLGYKWLNASGIEALTIEAIRELKAENDFLRSAYEGLEKRIQEIENQRKAEE